MIRNVGAHDPDVRRHTDRTCEDPRSGWHENPRSRRHEYPCSGSRDPRSESWFPLYPWETDSASQYKYIPTLRYYLAEIIVIKPFINILLRTDLSIRVRLASTLNNHPYRTYCFAGRDKRNFSEACAVEPETILIVWRCLWERFYFRFSLKRKNLWWWAQEPWISEETTLHPRRGGTIKQRSCSSPRSPDHSNVQGHGNSHWAKPATIGVIPKGTNRRSIKWKWLGRKRCTGHQRYESGELRGSPG